MLLCIDIFVLTILAALQVLHMLINSSLSHSIRGVHLGSFLRILPSISCVTPTSGWIWLRLV